MIGRDERGATAGAIEWAETANVPALVDPLAGASSFNPPQIASWEVLLRTTRWIGSNRPDLILRTGDLPTSKTLRSWLQELSAGGVPVVYFDPEQAGRDPDSTASDVLPAPITPELILPVTESSWVSDWCEAGLRAKGALDDALSSQTEVSEPALIGTVINALGSEGVLFVAASMPVRDLELVQPGAGGPRCVANRGANGIDGTIATAAGHAAQTGRRTVLVTGDVAFAHDIGGLAAVRESGADLTVIVFDNGGGAIFDNLAISAASDVYERFVFTPPRIDFEAAAAVWGLRFSEASDCAQLAEAIQRGDSTRAPEIVVVRLDRLAAGEARREAVEAASAAG